MPEPTVTPDQLRSRQAQENVHQRLTPASVRVHPLAEEAGAELGRRYGEAVTELLRPTTLAAAVNGLNDSELPDDIRWLVALPHVVAHALQRAESEGTLDADDPARAVRVFAEETAYRDFIELLVDRVAQRDVIEPLARDLGLDPGDVSREELVRLSREQGVDIREEHLTGWLAGVLQQARDDRGAAEGPRGASAPPGPAPAAAPGGVTDGADAVPEARRPVRPRPGGSPPPALWGVDCRLGIPGEITESPSRGDLLMVARTIAFLYLFSERQPLFAAMDVLRERVLASDLFIPPAVPEDVVEGPEAVAPEGVARGTDARDELCDLRLFSYSWNTEVDPLTLRKRADVAAVIGIRDAAATAAVNTEFARAADRLVDVLAATATDSYRYSPEWARAVAADLSLQLAGSFRTALTDGVLVHVALWRRQFALASRMFTRPTLRNLLGVGSDPDETPAPAIRKVLPSARLDAASLQREWQALDRVLALALHLSTGVVVDDAEFAEAAAAAVTLRALRGRLRVPADPTAFREPVQTR